MLQIKNQDKLLGKKIYSKFLPQIGEWSVVSILKDEISYDIKIENTKTRDWDKIHINRQPYVDTTSFEVKYKIWGLDKEKSEEKSKLIGKPQIQDIDMLLIQMVTVLNKMRPTT